jgi:hypothetical protein
MSIEAEMISVYQVPHESSHPTLHTILTLCIQQAIGCFLLVFELSSDRCRSERRGSATVALCLSPFQKAASGVLAISRFHYIMAFIMSYIPQVSCSRCSRPPDPQSEYGTLCQIGRSNFQAVSGILFCVVLLLILWHPHVCASYPFTSLELRSSAPRPPIPHSAYRRNPFLPRDFNPLLQKESFSLMAISPIDKNHRSKNPLLFSSPPSPSYPFCQKPLSTKTPSVLRGVHCACLRMHTATFVSTGPAPQRVWRHHAT